MKRLAVLLALLLVSCGPQAQALGDAPTPVALPTPVPAQVVERVRLEDYGAVSSDKGERATYSHILFTCYSREGERLLIALPLGDGLVVVRPETAILLR